MKTLYNFATWFAISYIMLSTVVILTDCCSSKVPSFPKLKTPRNSANPRETTDIKNLETSRKNKSNKKPTRTISEQDVQIVQQMISARCPPSVDMAYCLDRGHCFVFKISNYSYPYCECFEGYYGERCERKYSTHYMVYHKLSLANVCYGGIAALLAASGIVIFHKFRLTKFQKFSHIEPG